MNEYVYTMTSMSYFLSLVSHWLLIDALDYRVIMLLFKIAFSAPCQSEVEFVENDSKNSHFFVHHFILMHKEKRTKKMLTHKLSKKIYEKAIAFKQVEEVQLIYWLSVLFNIKLYPALIRRNLCIHLVVCHKLLIHAIFSKPFTLWDIPMFMKEHRYVRNIGRNCDCSLQFLMPVDCCQLSAA